MKFILVESKDVDTIWPLVRDLLQEAVDRNLGEFTLEDIRIWLLHNQMNLWIIGNKDEIFLAVVTEFVIYPRETRLRIVLGGGKKNSIKKWFDIFWAKDSIIHRFARDHNVKRFEVIGRDGLIKILGKVGFKKYSTVLTREV